MVTAVRNDTWPGVLYDKQRHQNFIRSHRFAYRSVKSPSRFFFNNKRGLYLVSCLSLDFRFLIKSVHSLVFRLTAILTYLSCTAPRTSFLVLSYAHTTLLSNTLPWVALNIFFELFLFNRRGFEFSLTGILPLFDLVICFFFYSINVLMSPSWLHCIMLNWQTWAFEPVKKWCVRRTGLSFTTLLFGLPSFLANVCSFKTRLSEL